jgi:hypothetical protein
MPEEESAVVTREMVLGKKQDLMWLLTGRLYVPKHNKYYSIF